MLPYFVVIHLTAAAGLLLFPLPGWRIFLGTVALAWIGGIGTTVCYHRALAHRALRLHRVTSAILIFFAVFNGSGSPDTWVASHRKHHAFADTEEDVSSPVWHGFWWAHLRWLWQSEAPSIARLCPDLHRRSYGIWKKLQPAILAQSFFGGLYFGAAAFFWLGAIRLVFSLHAQCFVNSICHSERNAVDGDYSRNVPWLAFMHLLQGENWHRNHHARPALARLGRSWRQPDLGYAVICILEWVGLVSEVRHAQDWAQT